MRMIVIIYLFMSVMGCAASRSSFPGQMVSVTDNCPYVVEHVTSDGTVIPSGYACSLPLTNPTVSTGRYSVTPVTQGENTSPSDSTVTTGLPSDCTFVAGYVRKDGNAVSPHVRCRTYSGAEIYYNTSKSVSRTINPHNNSAPCVTSSCGSVSVKGYYRKDGTYVRPHSRRR